MQDIRIPYNPAVWRLLLGIVLFGGGGTYSISKALHNDKGLIINHFIKLSVFEATIFHWVLAGVALTFAGISLLSLFFRFLSSKEVILTDQKIFIPKSQISNKIIALNYTDIVDLKIQKQSYMGLIDLSYNCTIFYREGKVKLSSTVLPDKKSFDMVVNIIIHKIKQSRMKINTVGEFTHPTQ